MSKSDKYDLRLARLFTRFCLFRRSAASLRPDQSSSVGVIMGMGSFWTFLALDDPDDVLALLVIRSNELILCSR